MDHDMESDDNPESPDLNEDKTYEPDKSLDPETDKEKIDVVNKLGNLIGAKRIITQGSYNDLSNFAKRLKVTVGRTVLKFFVAIMGPEAEAEFGGKICSIYQPKKTVENKPKDDILQAFAEQYERVPDKITKRIMLGPVAAKCSYREVLEKIPGLSYFLYNKARQCFKAEEIPENLPKTFHRYDEQKIITFVEFFTSPHCMVLLPYGETSVKLSNGVKLDVAANMRMQSHKQIIRMFRIKMEEEGRMNEVLPLRTMYAILEHCHAKKSKELTCVDYFLAAALDGFDALKKVLDHWMKTEDLTVEQSKAFINELKIGQEYLQTDFSLHLQQHTEVISHCINHALGDPDNEAFTNECEQHLTVCPKCEALTKTLNDLKNHIDNMVQNCKMENCEELEDLEIKQIEIDYAVYNILELKSHIVRSTLSEMERAKDINLLDETKAYITLDWAQKLLPTKYRETQKDYFGKSGMSYHIAHVQTVKDGESVEFSYVHIIEKNKQVRTRM
uniref:Uncharacterized protein n=1 Tax=Panagrolaimus superbus TaxID=310955 RepID=A0A914Y5R8_9BILA